MLGGVDSALGLAVAAVFGLMLGSFLNVVIYRLPKMLELQWAQDAAGTAGTPAPVGATAPAPFNLMTPRSRCGACGHPIRWHENVPVLSYLLLRGKCAACGAHFSLRYPLVELATAGLAAFCASHWGFGLAGLSWFGFSAALLTLALIDWDTTLLPDDITLPLLWAGLLASSVGWTGVPLPDALWGAMGGYLSLWSVYWAFKLLTGKEGMGYGDFKLLAALGAWFGWPALVPIVLVSSVIGVVVGLALKLSVGLREGGYLPFGPFLAGAGGVAMVFGPHSLLRAVGL